MRERYEAYMQEPEKVEAILREGVERIRPMARALVDRCRNAVGLRAFKPLQAKKAAVKAKKSKASLKQYREKDGLFYFKLVNGQGKTLLTPAVFHPVKRSAPISRALRLPASEH